MTDTSYIEKTVMKRVRRMRVLRMLFSNAALAAVVCVAALWGIGREVWVARVLQNAPADISELPRFYVAAFSHTRLIVQALSLAALAALILLARETARFISAAVMPRHA